jgi:hypothetical protein
MNTQSTLPFHYDMDYVIEALQAAGVTNHYGYTHANGGIRLVYRAEDFDTVQEVLDAYPVDYANDVLRQKLLDQVAATRWQKQQMLMMNGAPMKSDPETIAALTAAVVLMDANPDSPQTRRWKAGPSIDDWVTLDRDTLVAIGTAVATHVQACFDKEEELSLALLEAKNIFELFEVNLDDWP